MIPVGLIICFDTLIAPIPPGWLVCDGDNGTPDLRNFLIHGQADGLDPGPGETESTHTHVIDDGSHTHEFTGGNKIESGDDRAGVWEAKGLDGTTDASTSLPPFHSLIFIIKA